MFLRETREIVLLEWKITRRGIQEAFHVPLERKKSDWREEL